MRKRLFDTPAGTILFEENRIRIAAVDDGKGGAFTALFRADADAFGHRFWKEFGRIGPGKTELPFDVLELLILSASRLQATGIAALANARLRALHEAVAEVVRYEDDELLDPPSIDPIGEYSPEDQAEIRGYEYDRVLNRYEASDPLGGDDPADYTFGIVRGKQIERFVDGYAVLQGKVRDLRGALEAADALIEEATPSAS